MTTTDTDVEDRRGYIAGLRAIADTLEANPNLPLPHPGTEYSELSIFTFNREDLLAWARALPGTWRKEFDDESEAFGFELHGKVEGLHVVVYGDRGQVCTRRVVAVREVEKETPDPDALASVPTVTVTETVEDVEWVCAPLLAPSEQVSA